MEILAILILLVVGTIIIVIVSEIIKSLLGINGIIRDLKKIKDKLGIKSD